MSASAATLTDSVLMTQQHGLSYAADRAELVKGALLSCFYFAVAQTGLFTTYDGPLFAVGASICLPAWRPYLLLLSLSVHDAPGQADPSVYYSVVGITGLMIVSAMFGRREQAHTELSSSELWRLLIPALLLVGYGFLSSFFQHRFGLHEQSDRRPYPLVGGFMISMMVAGWLAHREMISDPHYRSRLKIVCICVVAHILMIGGLQVLLGPWFGASPSGVIAITSQFQLIDDSQRGIARLTGPFLSPNSLALIPSLFLLLYLSSLRTATVQMSFVWTFLVVGLTVSLLGGARTMFVFYLCGTAALMWTRSPAKAMLLGFVCAPLVLLADVPWGDMLHMIRLQNLQSFGYRGLFWQATLSNMDRWDWLFGFGMTHFPVFFENHTGMHVADPHNWILSMAGMFGAAGLLFYLILGHRLMKQCFSSNIKYRAIAACLLLLFFGRDLSNMQYVVNNHPVCCLNWIVLGAALQREVFTDSESQTDQMDS